jgi:hypothetical protein
MVGWAGRCRGRSVRCAPKFDEFLGRLLGGILVGTLTLVGFNVVVDNLVDWLDWGSCPSSLGWAWR